MKALAERARQVGNELAELWAGFLKLSDIDPVFPSTRWFTAKKQGDASTYHYAVSCASQKNSWELERAWRTDPDGNVIEEYPIP